MKGTERPKERGTNMKTRVIAVLVALAAVAVFTTEASAMYHAGMGVFMQRDPGAGAGGHARMGAGGTPAAAGHFIPRDPTGSNQYADGMNLYEYVQSRPTMGLDPEGTRVIYGSKYHRSLFVHTAVSERNSEKTMQAVGAYGSFQQYQRYKSVGTRFMRRYRPGRKKWRSMRTSKYANWQATIPFECLMEDGRLYVRQAKSYSPTKNIDVETNLKEGGGIKIPLPLGFGISAGWSGSWTVNVDPKDDIGAPDEDGAAVLEGRITAWWIEKRNWSITASWNSIKASTGGPGGHDVLAQASSKKYTVRCKCNPKTGKPEIDITLGQ